MSLKGVAQETLTILDAGGYTAPGGSWVALESAQAEALAGTRLYTPDELAALPAPAARSEPAALRLVDATTQVAAHGLVAPGVRVGALNFASARNPGGGFLSGARAQEEDLTRCSGLYPCLASSAVRPYYTYNRARKTLLYSDHMIFSPGVPFFRTVGRPGKDGYLLDAAFRVDVITAPAPNAGALRRGQRGSELVEALRQRALRVLTLAAAQGVDALVLGAWGCGVFKNDPEQVAAAFLDPLQGELRAAFREVVFAIPSKVQRNHDAFAGRLG